MKTHGSVRRVRNQQSIERCRLEPINRLGETADGPSAGSLSPMIVACPYLAGPELEPSELVLGGEQS